MKLSRLTQFHEDPQVIGWWRGRLGRVLDWLTPLRRRTVLVAGAIFIGIKEPLSRLKDADDLPVPTDPLGSALVVVAIFGILLLVYRAAVMFASLPAVIRRHPHITLHLLYWGFLAVLWVTTPEAGPWRAVMMGVAIFLPFLLWRCGYLLFSGQQKRMAGVKFADHLICLLPVYGGSNTPYGKGIDFLSRNEAKTSEELAKSQLAGIKLLILSGVWSLALRLLDGVLYGPGNSLTRTLGGHTVGVPKLHVLIEQGGQAPFFASWASIYCELIWQVLSHAARGHQIIAVLRLFGFNVFRNTYKPLQAESVVEFWNRYYYYFKELMANFFFLPTFMALGKRLAKWPNLRLLAAVFAAAFVGNMYYHLLQKEDMLAQGEVYDAVYLLRSRFFYCFLLAVGIFVSMKRQQGQGGQPRSTTLAARVLRIAAVWTFFSLIFIWNAKGGAPFVTRVNFFLGLFGLA